MLTGLVSDDINYTNWRHWRHWRHSLATLFFVFLASDFGRITMSPLNFFLNPCRIEVVGMSRHSVFFLTRSEPGNICRGKYERTFPKFVRPMYLLFKGRGRLLPATSAELSPKVCFHTEIDTTDHVICYFYRSNCI